MRTAIGLVAVAAVSGVVLSGAVPAVADGDRTRAPVRIAMQDDCDRVSFTEALGPGACVGDGDTTFDELVQSLVEGDPDGHWRNHPRRAEVRQGQPLRITNEGGEFHTFTHVARYGPGCVPEINALMGLEGPPAADCAAAFSDPQTALAPRRSGTVHTHHMHVGRHRFECMLHPWMRTTVTVRRR